MVLNQLVDYKDMLLEAFIHQDSTTEHAHSSEVPVFSTKPNSRASEDFNKLTKEIYWYLFFLKFRT